jgi:tRNA U55 pseudouridine synthase TruB
LLGEECRKQKEYAALDKEYEIDVLLDIASDTGDVLGFPNYSRRETRVDEKILSTIIKNERGIHRRKYPPYSSKTVNGKPLFLYSLEGTLTEDMIPEHDEHIYSIKKLGTRKLSKDELDTRIKEMLATAPRSDEPSKVLGADFRQDEVKKRWQALFDEIPNRDFAVLSLRVRCGSGAYMRSLASRIGEALGTKGLALSINRTKIGKLRAHIWTKSYS